MRHWWQEAVIYQIYPRSFKDSNGDGIGDLQGIISKLDHLKWLGINVLWLSPFYKSPNADNGYDISDYQNIMDEFGTMADFDQLLAAAHQKGIKLIIDLVVNHSSDEHFWFQESRKSKDNPYRDYYIWRPPLNGHATPPNDWISFFSGKAWDLDPITNEYYLHLFAKKQPDLNWENPKLRQEIYKMMHFWCQKGVDGFRMDVIAFLSKDTSFPNYAEGQFGNLKSYANGPRIHEFLQEMHREVLCKYDVMTVGEAFGVESHQINDYVGKSRKELNMCFHFDYVGIDRDEKNFFKAKPNWKLSDLKAILAKWDVALGEEGWNSLYFGNHDNPRMVSRFGNDGAFHKKSAKMLATVLMTMRGTPYIYQGDEIGMTNTPFHDIKELDDIQAKNAWQELVVEGGADPVEFMKDMNLTSRDHARTPVCWDASRNAGFTDGERTWLKINPLYEKINVTAAYEDKNSILWYYKKLIAFRQATPTLIYGAYQDIAPEDEAIFAYSRVLESDMYLIIHNFSDKITYFTVPKESLPKTEGIWRCCLANYEVTNGETQPNNHPLEMRPYESRVYHFTEMNFE